MKKIIAILALAVTAAACTYHTEEIFDKPSATRVSEEMTRVNDLLKGASEGWLMYYYPDTQYGGYNLICKFNDDNTVTVGGEIAPSGYTCTSHYKTEQSQGVVLSFDEYNDILHFFSDPVNPANIGTNGKGMLGDFEFRVVSATESSIELLGKKHGSRVMMTPLSAGFDWDGYFGEVLAFEEYFSAANYSLKVGDIDLKCSSNYRTISYFDEETQESIVLPFIYTNNGLDFYKEVTVGGATFKTLTYSQEKDACLSSDQKVCFEIVPVPLSILLTDPNLMWFVSADGIAPKLLPAFEKAKLVSAGEGEDIVYMLLGALSKAWGFCFVSGGYVGTFTYGSEIIDDNTVKLTLKSADSNATWYYNAGYNLIPGIFNSTFTLSTDNPKNPSYIKLTNTEDPDSWLRLSATEVVYPLGKH